MEFETVRFNSKEIASLRKLTRIPTDQWQEWGVPAPDSARRFGTLRASTPLNVARDRETINAAFHLSGVWSDENGEMARHGFTSAETDALLSLNLSLERLIEATA